MFKNSAVSIFDCSALNVTNRKALPSPCLLFDLSLNLHCHAIKSGPCETERAGSQDVDGPNAMSVTEQ